MSMLKGSRDAVLHRLQPISIHGQLSYDLHYTFADEPDSQMRVARVGGEAIGTGLQAGDRVSPRLPRRRRHRRSSTQLNRSQREHARSAR